MSLRHLDRIRDDLTAAVHRHPRGVSLRGPRPGRLRLGRGHLPDSALVTLHRSDLWEITSRAAASELLVGHEMEATLRLEATTSQ